MNLKLHKISFQKSASFYLNRIELKFSSHSPTCLFIVLPSINSEEVAMNLKLHKISFQKSASFYLNRIELKFSSHSPTCLFITL